MRREPDNGRSIRWVALVASLGCLGLLAAGCSSGSGATKTTPPPAARNTVPSSSVVLPTSSAPTTAAPVADSGLTGSWSGQYSGAFTGTFKLTWQQTGSSLSGSIALSTNGAAPQTESLNGTVTGSTISFGTVGSQAITYSGKVSGASMSGTYQIAGQPGGPWSATKS
jgi:hypothetical protein